MSNRTLAKIRTAELAQIHIAKKQLALSDDDYRAAILAASKGATDSAGALTPQQRVTVLAHFKRAGFKVRHARKDSDGKRKTPSRPIADRSDQLRMMRALWLRLHESGGIDSADEQGLVSFAKKQTGIEALEWLSVEQNQKCIEIMKRWLERVRIKPFHLYWYELHRLGRVNGKSDRFIRNSLQTMLQINVVECSMLQHQQCLDKVQAWALDVQNK